MNSTGIKFSNSLLTPFRRDVLYYGLVETPYSLATLFKDLSENRRAPFRDQLRGLIFGAEDYAQEVGITRTPALTEMIYARQHVVNLAKAYHLEALDLVSSPYTTMTYLGLHQLQGSGCTSHGV
jgi:citrate lyase beta subunit